MNDNYLHFKKFLNTNGLKLTSQRKLVLDILLSTSEEKSSEEIFHEAISIDPFISLSTVYRSVKQLQKAGIIVPIPSQSGATKYIKTACGSSHFLVCECCGKKHPLKNRYVDTAHHIAAEEMGFASNRCVLNIYGICSKCALKHKADA
ncbi:MAG: Fur family transcriptional regulator [Desulfovibrio sp.]